VWLLGCSFRIHIVDVGGLEGESLRGSRWARFGTQENLVRSLGF